MNIGRHALYSHCRLNWNVSTRQANETYYNVSHPSIAVQFNNTTLAHPVAY